MHPNLKNGQSAWLNKISMGIALPILDFPFGNILPYKLFPNGITTLKRGEIIVFYHLGMGRPNLIIKRVVALPKERYAIRKGSVYIEKDRLQESYLTMGTVTPIRPQIKPFVMERVPKEVINLGAIASYSAQHGIPSKGMVPKGSVLVLGDKRNTSQDSRVFGFVPISYILGKVIMQ